MRCARRHPADELRFAVSVATPECRWPCRLRSFLAPDPGDLPSPWTRRKQVSEKGPFLPPLQHRSARAPCLSFLPSIQPKHTEEETIPAKTWPSGLPPNTPSLLTAVTFQACHQPCLLLPEGRKPDLQEGAWKGGREAHLPVKTREGHTRGHHTLQGTERLPARAGGGAVRSPPDGEGVQPTGQDGRPRLYLHVHVGGF